MQDLETELNQEVMDIDARWNSLSKNITTMPIPLEKTDVKVTQISLVWLPTT